MKLRNVCLSLLLVLPLTLAPVSVRGAVFTSDTIIPGGDLTYEAQEIIVTNCTVTIEGSHFFTSIKVLKGGVVTHSSVGPSTVILNVPGDVYVAEGGQINLDGKGSGPMTGPGAGAFGRSGGSGASYGGLGGGGAEGVVNPFSDVYGSFASSLQVGSGGGDGALKETGGFGGGMMSLTVGGIVRVEGRISANGGNSPGYGGGGGSGGGIYIKALTLAGAGQILAKGGDGDPGQGGGGGGGRIVVEPGTNFFTGLLDASGGLGYEPGGPGSVYVKLRAESVGRLVFDNKGTPGITGLANGPSPFDLSIEGGTVIRFMNVTTFRNLNIGRDSWIRTTGMQLTIHNNVVIEPGGGIDVNGLGYPAGSGLGAGRTGYLISLYPGGGGGYGGRGGDALAPNANGGQSYGYIETPTDVGSGGGFNYPTPRTTDGAGGGAVRMNVSGALVCNGRISADGSLGAGTSGGGGSGGSIWLTVGTLAGGGVISAAGGAGQGWGDYAGGGGGGGRIAIEHGANLFMGSMMAHGGQGFIPGGAGTIYTKGKYPAIGSLLVDNRGLSGTNTVWPGGSISPDLIVRGGARFSTPFATFNSVRVESNSCIVASQTLSFASMNDMIVAEGGAVLADRAGNPGNVGAGRGIGSPQGSSGGGHGGYGGALMQFPGGNVYGSITTPRDLGSGGGGYPSPMAAGSGGGGILITVKGLLWVDGRLSANGGDATNAFSAGGSGGYINISAGTVAGAGTISANGGAGGSNGGGGGGGRIAITSSMGAFSGVISAVGGGGYSKGGAGTIFLGQPSGPTGTVIVDNGGTPGAQTPLLSSDYLDVVVRAGAIVLPLSQRSINSLSIGSNSWMVATNQSLVVSKGVLIEAGGGITANGAGYRAQLGPGSGRSYMIPNAGYVGGGGGYAGYGGEAGGGTNLALGGMPYGYSVTAPMEPGSGGGLVPFGGSGGGAMKLTMGSLVLNGSITAEGLPGNGPGAGGGAGGSIQISAGLLAGTGFISVNGGAGNGLGGGGSGGRIALIIQTNAFAGGVTAFGGIGSSGAGGAGTICMSSYPVMPHIIVDNGGHFGANTVLEPQGIWDVTVRNGAVLQAASPTAYVKNLQVEQGGTFTFHPNTVRATLRVTENLLVSSNGVLTVAGMGWSANSGPGAGHALSSIGSGAGYGGFGGASSKGPGGVAYGYSAQPIDHGSGGGMYPLSNLVGSQGGGALRMIVGGICRIEGVLNADGVAGIQNSAGGGSGGSIWLDARVLLGNGVIRAKGGAGEPYFGGGGAGGRIAVYTPTDLFNGIISCAGGPGYMPGEAGTVFKSATPLPLQVVSCSPSGIITQAVGEVVLTFNTPLDSTSLEPEDIVLTTPAGVLSSTNLEFVVDRLDVLRIKFPPQLTEGIYRIRFGPEVQNLHSQSMPAVFESTFAIAWPTIEGTVVTHTGEAVQGVRISSNGGGVGVVTDPLGRYKLTIPPSGRVSVAASKPNLCFAPARMSYTDQACSLAGQDFVAMPETKVRAAMAVPGNLVLRWDGTAGLNYQVLCSTNLLDWEAVEAPLGCTDSGEMNFQVQPGSAPQRFFRVEISSPR